MVIAVELPDPSMVGDWPGVLRKVSPCRGSPSLLIPISIASVYSWLSVISTTLPGCAMSIAEAMLEYVAPPFFDTSSRVEGSGTVTPPQ